MLSHSHEKNCDDIYVQLLATASLHEAACPCVSTYPALLPSSNCSEPTEGDARADSTPKRNASRSMCTTASKMSASESSCMMTPTIFLLRFRDTNRPPPWSGRKLWSPTFYRCRYTPGDGVEGGQKTYLLVNYRYKLTCPRLFGI